MTFKLAFLLIIFQLKHFFADYPLQNEYMLGKFKEEGWIFPLASHCGVHALFTFIISLLFVEFHASVWLALFDFVVHFTMDRVKASPEMLGKYKALTKKEFINCKLAINSSENIDLMKEMAEDKLDSNKKFWWSLGLDQGVHHLTHYIIIGILL